MVEDWLTCDSGYVGADGAGTGGSGAAGMPPVTRSVKSGPGMKPLVVKEDRLIGRKKHKRQPLA
jgi:hypothetical protein